MIIETVYTLHEHTQKNKRIHWDLRIVRKDKRKAWSFAIPKSKLPKYGEKVLAIRTDDHNLKVINLQGKTKSGDSFKILEKGECTITKLRPNHIVIRFHGTIMDKTYGFINIKDDNWLIIVSK